MEGETEVARPGCNGEPRSGRSHEGQDFKQLKVRTCKDDARSPRKSTDASNHSILGGHGGPPGWLWRNSYNGAPTHTHPESPKYYNPFSGADSSRCPSSPVQVPVTMAYTPAPSYMVFPVMLGTPDSPRGGLTPLMGSPVSTPTAMMFPQTPFAQHPSAGPFAPPQGPGGPGMRPSSVSGAPQVSGGPGGHEASATAFFHPLFNGFNAFGPPGMGMAPAPHGAFPGPAGPMGPMAAQCGGAKQPRNSAAGEKPRPYQPSPLKPGPRKSSGNGGPPVPGIAFPPPMLSFGGTGAGTSASGARNPGAATAGSVSTGGASSGSSSSPAQTSSTGSSVAAPRGGSAGRSSQNSQPQSGAQHQQSNGSGYNTPLPAVYSQQPMSGGGGASGGTEIHGEGSEASPVAPASSASPAPPAGAVSPDTLQSYSSATSAARPSVGSIPAADGSSGSATSRQLSGINPATAAAAAAVVAAAAAAVSNMSTGPTPRTSYTGPSATPPPRTSVSGGIAVAASGRTSSSGMALPGAAAAGNGNSGGLNSSGVNGVAGARVSLSEESSGPMAPAGLDADAVGLSSGDVDIPSYGNFNSYGMMQHMAAAAANAATAWGFYDPSSAAANGMGSQQMWPGAAPRLYGATPTPILAHHPHSQHPHQVAAMAAAAAAAAGHNHQQSTASMQQPLLLQAAMAAMAANAVPTPMAAGMPCYVTPSAPTLESDYMTAAAEQLAQLHAIQGTLLAQQNLRAAAAASMVDMQHPVMAAAAAGAGGLPSGGIMVNPLLSSALASHHAAAMGHAQHQHAMAHAHLGAGGMHMPGLGMGIGIGMGPRPPRQRHGSGNTGGPSGSAGGAGGAGGGTGVDGQMRLNARQRRTLRRAKERAIKSLMDMGKSLVARTMGNGGAEGDEGTNSGCDIPSGGGYDDSDDGERSEDLGSPARPAVACVSACSATAGSATAGASSPEVSLTGGGAASVSSSAASAPAAGCTTAAGVAAGKASSGVDAPADAVQQMLAGHVGSTAAAQSPSSSNASSVCEAAGSSGGAAASGVARSARSQSSSVAGPADGSSLAGAAASNTPCSGKVSPLLPEDESSPAPAPAAPPPPPGRAGAPVGGGVNATVRASPAPTGRSTSAGSAGSNTGVLSGSAVVAAAALASGQAADVDIAELIQQLNLKRDEGLVDEKLLRDLEIINNLIGALKTNVPNAAPSYNAQGRKPSVGHPHSHGHNHHSHHNHHNQNHHANMVNAAHAIHYLSGLPKLAKGFAVGY